MMDVANFIKKNIHSFINQYAYIKIHSSKYHLLLLVIPQARL